jgi:hypothetical protein
LPNTGIFWQFGMGVVSLKRFVEFVFDANEVLELVDKLVSVDLVAELDVQFPDTELLDDDTDECEAALGHCVYGKP